MANRSNSHTLLISQSASEVCMSESKNPFLNWVKNYTETVKKNRARYKELMSQAGQPTEDLRPHAGHLALANEEGYHPFNIPPISELMVGGGVLFVVLALWMPFPDILINLGLTINFCAAITFLM